MNYQQTKTIQMYSINKNLLLLGLLVIASFMQACGGVSKKGGNKVVGNADNQALLDTLGKFDQMTAVNFKEKLGKDAKEACTKEVKIHINEKDVETLKLPKEIEIEDETTKTTEKVSYFKALGGKLSKEKGMLKFGKIVENEAISGLFKKVLGEFSKDAKNKNAKVFVLVKLLELQEKVQVASSKAALQQAVSEFKDEIAKVKHDANGVLVKIDKEGNVDFVPLTEVDKANLKGKLHHIHKGDSEKYVLSESLYNFIDTEVIKPIDNATN